MHIPSEMLHGGICPITAAIAIGGIVTSLIILNKKDEHPSVSGFAQVSATIFALQMLNYPLGGGLSGHIVGGVLAASLLGIPLGILSMSIVLLMQTLLFADGGILMLGANITNMSLIGAGIGGIIYYALLRKYGHDLSLFVAGVSSILLAVLAVCIEMLVSGYSNPSIVRVLVTNHIAIAGVEGISTCLLFHLFKTDYPMSRNHSSWSFYSLILISALLAAPFASACPDAFEGIVSQFHIIPYTPHFVHAPLAEYHFPVLKGYWSILAASTIGVTVTMAFSIVVGNLFRIVGRHSK
jgi:cobalt/nickel transport system permease protein